MHWLGLGVLCVIGLLGMLSYQLFSVLLQPIQADLRLTDTSIGLISGLGIATIGAIAAFPVGWAADRFGRRLMLCASLVTWSAFALGMGLATSQSAFIVATVGINLGDAAVIPLLYGIVATAYSGKGRDVANAILVVTLTVGGTAMIPLGGFLLQHFTAAPIGDLQPWRAVCVAVAIVGFVVAPFLVTVPAQSASASFAPQQEPPEATYAGFFDFLKINGSTISITFFGLTFYFVAYYTFLFWAPALLERRFGLPTAEASIALGTPLILSSIGGIALANIGLALVRTRWRETAPLRMVVTGCIIALLPTMWAAFTPSADMFILAFALMNLGVTVSLALAPALLQNCAPDAYRSRTIALFPIIALLVRVVFPALVPWLSQQMGGSPEALLNINAIMLAACLLASILILTLIEKRYAALARDVMQFDRNANHASM